MIGTPNRTVEDPGTAGHSAYNDTGAGRKDRADVITLARSVCGPGATALGIQGREFIRHSGPQALK